MLFDGDALDLEEMSYIVGFYFYILAGHKKANYYLMNEGVGEVKRVLYLRSFDYQAAAQLAGDVAIGYGNGDAIRFTWKLPDCLAGSAEIFKALSPEDLHWETVAAQIHFNGDFSVIIRLAGTPIRSIFLNAHEWKNDIAQLVDRMDYFVIYISSINESVLWEIDLLRRKGRTQHTTIVIDAGAVARTSVPVAMQKIIDQQYSDNVLWRKPEQARTLGVQELHDRLALEFLVVSPQEFEESSEEQKRRIMESEESAGRRHDREPIPFRFYPAVDPSELQGIREVDAVLGELIHQVVASKTLTNLPWFLIQVQLKVFTTLMLGDHEETGRALAVYAAVIDVVRSRIAEGTRRRDHLTRKGRMLFDERLTEHFRMAEYVSWTLLSFGQSHEFGDYRARATAVYEEEFAAASAAVQDFYAKADRCGPRRRTAA
ncbi:hypothetical protein GCM10009837_11530 [Streptomyces durmitorensis]